MPSIPPIVLIGESPGAKTPARATPLTSPMVMRRLTILLGITPEEYGDTLKLNLIDEWPGKTPSGKGSRFPVREARVAAANIVRSFAGRRVIVAVGKRVATAVGFRPDYFVAQSMPSFGIVVPHPSGMNRWWNDPRRVSEARESLRAALEEAWARRSETRPRLKGRGARPARFPARS